MAEPNIPNENPFDISAFEKFRRDMQFTYPRWTEEYLKKGQRVFSDNEIAVFKRIQLRYYEDYIPFLQKIQKNLKTTKGRVRPGQAMVLKDIDVTIGFMNKVIDYISKIIQQNDLTVASKDDIKAMFDSMAAIEEKMMRYREFAQKDLIFRKAVEDIESATKINFEKVVQTTRVVQREIKKFTPEMTRLERMRAKAPEVYDLGAQAWRAGLGAVLGPYGKLAEVAWKTFKGIRQRRREARIERERAQFAAELLRTREYSPEAVREQYARLKAGTDRLETAVKKESLGGQAAPEGTFGGARGAEAARMAEKAAPEPEIPRVRIKGTKEYLEPEMVEKMGLGEQIRAEAGEGAKETGVLGRLKSQRGSVNVGMFVNGLLLFFNKGAYQARWTREVMEMFKKIKLGEKGQEGLLGMLKGLKGGWGKAVGVLTKVGSAIARFLPALGPVLAVAAAAAGGWALGRAIGSKVKIGGKSIDEHLQGFFAKHLFKAPKPEQMTKHPDVLRMMELQKQGKSAKEAADILRAEKGLPPLEGAKPGPAKEAALPTYTPKTMAPPSAVKDGKAVYPIAQVDERGNVVGVTQMTETLKDKAVHPEIVPQKEVPVVRAGVEPEQIPPTPVPMRRTVEAVRTVPPQTGSAEIASALSKLNGSIDVTNKILKETGAGGGTAVRKTAKDNVYSGRDPLVEMLNMGRLGVAI